MEPPIDLIVKGEPKDEVILYLNLSKVTNLAYLAWSVNMVICLNHEMLGTHFKLA